MIGDNIKIIRKLKEIGLNELARAAGVNASYLSAIELKKKNNPSVITLEKIAKALNVGSEEFFKTEPMSAEDMQYYEGVYEANRENRNIIPEKFTRTYEAGEYIEMHQMFANIDVNKMSNEDVLNFGNDLLEQMRMVSYKYKK